MSDEEIQNDRVLRDLAAVVGACFDKDYDALNNFFDSDYDKTNPATKSSSAQDNHRRGLPTVDCRGASFGKPPDHGVFRRAWAALRWRWSRRELE